MGKLRAKNGHLKPYGVKWWAIGNEMYGDWQLGHMPLEEYVKKHNRVVEAMRKVDPEIQAIAVGAMGPWSEQMLTTCSDHMSLISEHLYCQDKEDVVEHTGQIAAESARWPMHTANIARPSRITCGQGHPHRSGRMELLVRRQMNTANWARAIFCRMVWEWPSACTSFSATATSFSWPTMRRPLTLSAAIKTTKTEAEFETTGLVLKLYRERFGTIPVQLEGEFAPLDIAAALSSDGNTLTVAIVNPTEQPKSITLKLDQGKLAGHGRRWIMTGPDKWSYNAPGKARQVDIAQTSLTAIPNVMALAPLSVTLYALALQ